PLAGLALGASYYSVFYVAFLGILTAVSPMVAHAYGGRQHRRIGLIVRNGIYLALASAAVVAFTFWFSEPVLLLAGQDSEPARLATSYLRALIPGLPPLLGFVIVRQITEATSESKPTLIFVAVGAVANLVLDYG